MSTPKSTQAPEYDAAARSLKAAIAQARSLHLLPSATVHCRGEPLFRSQVARDLGCLLDVDPDVASWACLPFAARPGDGGSAPWQVPDFRVWRTDGRVVVMDAVASPQQPAPDEPSVIFDPVDRAVVPYQAIPASQIRVEPRLSNAKELLRYAGATISLGDRVRFLAMLEEIGPTPIADCLHAFKDTDDPIAAIAVLVLRRFVAMDLDERPIGPETVIRRQRI